MNARRLLICGVLVLSACAPPPTPQPTPTANPPAATDPDATPAAPRYRRTGPQIQPASGGKIARVGAALSLTGPMSQFGATQRSGIKLAQDEINTSGLLGRTRLEVIVEDDGSDRTKAAAAFQRFIENSHVLAIIGPTRSDIALSVDPLAQQAGVPVLAVSNAAGGITQIGNFIFRDCLSESQLTPHIINTLADRMPLHTAALLHSDSDANRAGSHGFKTALQNVGIHIVSEQTFARDATDLSTQFEDIKASQPDVLFITASGQIAASLLIQARSHGLSKIPIVGSSSFASDHVIRAAGDAAEGLIVGSAWSAASASPRNAQFINSYRARYGIDPDGVAAQAYSGVYIVAAALKQSGTVTDPRAVRDALEGLSGVDTPLGSFSFNAAHDPDYPPVVQVVRGGRFQLF